MVVKWLSVASIGCGKKPNLVGNKLLEKPGSVFNGFWAVPNKSSEQDGQQNVTGIEKTEDRFELLNGPVNKECNPSE